MRLTSVTPSLDPIQMLWVRGELSRMELLSVRSFIAQGHPVHLYSYDPPRALPPGVTLLSAASIVPEKFAPLKPAAPFAKGSMASFSDYFRYKLLFTQGGWWVDLDVVALNPFQGFPDIVVASTDEAIYGRTANNFIMRFPKGHAVQKACLESIGDTPVSELEFGKTGPLLLNSIIGPAGVAEHTQPREVFAPVPWNASEQLVRSAPRYRWDDFKHRIRRPHLACRFTHRTVAVHLWNETWRNAGRDKNALYPATSLYERLHRRYPA